MKNLLFCFLLIATNTLAQNADINLLKNINLNRNTHIDGFFRGITNSASPVSIGVPLVLLGVGLLKKDSISKRNAIYIGSSVVTAVAISTILKYAVNKDRPFVTHPFIQKVVNAGSPSFPSGHASDAFSLATSVSLAYPKWYIVAPAYLWAGAVGYSRMDLGVHYPSDVLVGAIVGAGSAYICHKINKKLEKKRK